MEFLNGVSEKVAAQKHSTFSMAKVLISISPALAENNVNFMTLMYSFIGKVYSSSGCWPSCAFHMHSVIFMSVKTAVKDDSSGEQA